MHHHRKIRRQTMQEFAENQAGIYTLFCIKILFNMLRVKSILMLCKTVQKFVQHH